MTTQSEWSALNDVRSAIQSPRGPKRPSTRNVLLALCSFANRGCVCWPSHVEIAKRAGLCTRTVQTHTQYAEKDGWIVRARRWYPSSRFYHTVYILQIPELRPELLAGGGVGDTIERNDR